MKFLILTLLLSHLSFAGQGGNGGDVVVCYDETNKIKDMQSYDFWNASNKFNLTVKTDNQTPYMEQIKKSLLRLSKIDPVLAETLLKHAQVFSPENIKNSKTVGLVPGIKNNGDGSQSVIPNEDTDPNCHKQEILRIAEFTTQPLPYEKPFKLSRYLWNAANEGVKFAIVQHEVIYKTLIEKTNETNSVRTQLYNAFISSEEFSEVTFFSYREFLKGLKLDSYDPFSLRYSDELIFEYDHFAQDDSGLQGILAIPYVFSIQGTEVRARYVEFDKNHNVRTVWLWEPQKVKLINGQTLLVKDVILTDAGEVIEGKFPGWTSLKVGESILPVIGDFEFYPNGTPKKLHAAVCGPFNYGGKRYSTSVGEYFVFFNDEGPQINFNQIWTVVDCAGVSSSAI